MAPSTVLIQNPGDGGPAVLLTLTRTLFNNLYACDVESAGQVWDKVRPTHTHAPSMCRRTHTRCRSAPPSVS